MHEGNVPIGHHGNPYGCIHSLGCMLLWRFLEIPKAHQPDHTDMTPKIWLFLGIISLGKFLCQGLAFMLKVLVTKECKLV